LTRAEQKIRMIMRISVEENFVRRSSSSIIETAVGISWNDEIVYKFLAKIEQYLIFERNPQLLVD
jgi:hypothetical protein